MVIAPARSRSMVRLDPDTPVALLADDLLLSGSGVGLSSIARRDVAARRGETDGSEAAILSDRILWFAQLWQAGGRRFSRRVSVQYM